MFWALIMEGADTRRMLEVFGRQGTGKLRLIPTDRQPTQEELDEALKQLKDMPRLLPFVVVVLIPVPGVSAGYALAAITLERWLGDRFRVLPNRFKVILEGNANSEMPD
jgi:hypothetical protein